MTSESGPDRQRPRTYGDLFIVRQGRRGLEILLVGRDDRDASEHGKVRMPEIAKRAGEKSADFLGRIATSELGVGLSFHIFMGQCSNPVYPGSHREHQIYLAELKGQPTWGRWYPLGNLPRNLLEQHLPMIYDALEVYLHLASPGFDRDYARVASREEREAHFGGVSARDRPVKVSDEYFAPGYYWQQKIIALLAERGVR